jgi:hypothetical protein
MTTNEPPPAPNDPPSPTTDLPSYGSVPVPPSEQPPAAPPAGSVPPPPGYQPPPAPGGYGAAPEQNKKALWSMILGIVGLVCCGIFAGIPALILSSLAKKEIAASGGQQTGSGMATAGLVLGILSVVSTIITIIYYTSN